MISKPFFLLSLISFSLASKGVKRQSRCRAARLQIIDSPSANLITEPVLPLITISDIPPQVPTPPEAPIIASDPPAPITTVPLLVKDETPPASKVPTPPQVSTLSPAPIIPSNSGAISFKDESLQVHNKERRAHGAIDLIWDDKLASFALDYAKKCVFKHSGGIYGENLAAAGGEDIVSLSSAVGLFNAEITEYDPKNPIPSHWTQVVWKDSTTVGCAAVSCAPGTIFPAMYGSTNYYVCEYNPPGNVIGQFGSRVQK